MNICLFTSSFLPNVGGMENVVHILALEYSKMGHQVVVLAKTPKKMKKAPEFPYPVYYYKRSRSEVFFLHSPKKMLQELHLKYKFDIIHAHQMYPTGYLAVKLAEKYNIPVVLTSHAGDVAPGSKYRKSKIKCSRMIRAMQDADFVTGVGTGTCEEIDRLTGCNKAYYLANGCFPPDNPELSLSLKEKLQAIGNPETFDLSVGRLHPAKGLDNLIRAYSILQQKGISTPPLLMAGDGQMSGQLEDLIVQLKLEKQIYMLGRVTPDERDWLLRHCRCFMQPSLREGMPLTVLESLAAGVPVIGTAIPGIRELLKDDFNGKVVPPGNPEALSETLEHLTADDYRRFHQNASLILETHAWPRIAEQYVAIFEKLIQKTIH